MRSPIPLSQNTILRGVLSMGNPMDFPMEYDTRYSYLRLPWGPIAEEFMVNGGSYGPSHGTSCAISPGSHGKSRGKSRRNFERFRKVS